MGLCLPGMRALLVVALAMALVAADDDEPLRLQDQLKNANAMTQSLMAQLSTQQALADERKRQLAIEMTAISQVEKQRDAAAASLKSVTDYVKKEQAAQTEFVKWSSTTKASIIQLNESKFVAENASAYLRMELAALQKQDKELDTAIATAEAKNKALREALAARPGLQGKEVQGGSPIVEAGESEDDATAVLVSSQTSQEEDEEKAAKAAAAKKTQAAADLAKAAEQKANAERVKAQLVVSDKKVDLHHEGSMKPEEMPCCVAHKGPSCIQVMVDNGCGMCSRDALKATPFLDGSVQTG